MSIRTKLLLSFLITTLVPVVIVAGLTITRIMNEANRDFESSSSLDMSIIDQTFTTFFDVISHNVSFMADMPAVTETDGNALTQYFGEGRAPSEVAMANGGREQAIFEIFSAIGENNPALGYVYMGDVDGGYLEWPGTAEYGDWDPRNRPWFTLGRDANYDIVRRDGYYWEPDDAVYVSVLKGYQDERGEFGGVVAIDVSLKSLTDMVQDIKFGDTGRIMMIEGSGTILVDGGNPENNFKSLSELSGPHFDVIANTESGVVELAVNGVSYQANIYQSESLGWTFVGMMETGEILSGARRIALTTAIVSLVLVISFMIGANFIARRIVSPINAVKENLRELAEGEGNLTTRISVQTRDETGDLARWFNQFMESTQTLIAAIKEKTLQMDGVSAETTQRAREMSESSTEQMSGIDQIVTATTEMSSAANEVATNSVETANISDTGLSATKDGKTVVDQSKHSVERLVSNIESSNEVIRALEQETDNINNILTTIQGIAEQTNLLALNAAIEAARAGEQGRGFAVVADEVRNLAQRTHDSTGEVSAILEKLVQQTQAVSATMERSTEESGETLALATKALQAFTAIEEVVQNIRDMTTQTASATEEQHLVTKDINKNVVEISDSANNVSSLSDQVKDLCQQQTDLSQELATLVSRFRT